MLRGVRIAALATLIAFAMPTAAYATDGSAVPLSWVHIGVSLAGLVVSVILLVEALTVRTVALGGAIAEKISYVVLAIVCLAAASLAQWTGNFVGGMTLEQIQFSSQVLVVVAMALFAAYFYSVRSAMQRYLSALTGSEQLAAEQADEWERVHEDDELHQAAVAAQEPEADARG